MSETHVIAALKECLPGAKDQTVLASDQPAAQIPLSNLDLTSLRMVEVCMHLEESLGIDIDLEEFEGAKTIGDLVQLCTALQTA